MLKPARFKAFSVAGTGPQPMIAASQPATAIERIFARGVKPRALARSALMISMADAPSDKADEVPAVTVPPFGLKAGRKAANCSNEAF